MVVAPVGEWKLVPAAHPRRGVALFENEEMARRQRFDTGEDRRVRVVDEAVGEVLQDELVVCAWLDQAGCKQRLRLRREDECFRCDAVKERFHSEAVARDDQSPVSRVPEREAPHAIEAVKTVLPPLFVRVKLDLSDRVRVTLVPMSRDLR